MKKKHEKELKLDEKKTIVDCYRASGLTRRARSLAVWIYDMEVCL